MEGKIWKEETRSDGVTFLLVSWMVPDDDVTKDLLSERCDGWPTDFQPLLALVLIYDDPTG
jgi:hypothetical protein